MRLRELGDGVRLQRQGAAEHRSQPDAIAGEVCSAAVSNREPPDMMSASEVGRGSWKSGLSKGGCVNFVLQIRQVQMWTRGEG